MDLDKDLIENSKRSLSQNFLTNQVVKNKICHLMKSNLGINSDTEIIEIGPGTGFLTEVFLSWESPVTALEIDSRAVDVLNLKFNHNSKFKVFNCDALEVINNPGIIKLNRKDAQSKLKVLLSNLPFNKGSRIMMDLPFNFFDLDFGVILQKEVALKFNPEKSKLTLFSAWLSLWWEIKISLIISRHNFSPKPKVDTALIIGKSKYLLNSLPLELKDLVKDSTKCRRYFALIKLLFASPRKSLKNNLAQAGINDHLLNEIFSRLGLDDNLRLGWRNYQKILHLLAKESEVWE